MTKQQTNNFSLAAFVFFVSVFIAAMWHLYINARQIPLSVTMINSVFGLGMITGVLAAGIGILLKHPFWGIITGASVCYLLALGYLVIGHGIPPQWMY